MIYPSNLFSPDPVSGMIRPSIIMICFETQTNIMKAKSAYNDVTIRVPKFGFALPMPNTGVADSQTNTFATAPGLISGAVKNFVEGVIPGGANTMSQATNMVVNPALTSVYVGSELRNYSCNFMLVPQSFKESAAIALILWMVKIAASPKKIDLVNKLGLLKAPYNFTIIFSNPVLELGTRFDNMNITSYTINYNATGYSSTYKDMFPKTIELTMNFVENGIKTRDDWSFGLF